MPPPRKTFRNVITFDDHPLSHGLVLNKQHYYPPALSSWARNRVSRGLPPTLPMNPSHVLTRQELDLVHRTGNAMTRAGNDHKSQSKAKAKALLETKQALQTVAERRRIRNRVQKSGHAYVSTKNIPNTIPMRIAKGVAQGVTRQAKGLAKLYREEPGTAVLHGVGAVMLAALARHEYLAHQHPEIYGHAAYQAREAARDAAAAADREAREAAWEHWARHEYGRNPHY